MVRALAGIVIATLAVYVWGFAFWGASGLPYTAWKPVPDEAGAAQMLLEHFPADGTYAIPGHGDPDTLAKALETGPVAFVHVTAREGRPAIDPGIGEALQAFLRERKESMPDAFA